MKVWILVLQNFHDGTNISVYASEAEARKRLYGFVSSLWEDMEVEEPIDGFTDNDAVGTFFDMFCDDYTYYLECKDVPAMPDFVIEDYNPEEIFLSEDEIRLASIGLQHVNMESLAAEMDESPKTIESKIIEVAKKLG